MAKFDKMKYPGFNKLQGETFDACYKRTVKAMRDLEDKSAQINPSVSIVGALIKFPYADGFAYYIVSQDKPITVQHVPYGDAWQADPVTIRGIDKSTVVEQLNRTKNLNDLFSNRG